MQPRCLGPAIGDADLDQDVGRRGFSVFDKDIEIAVIVKDAGIEQFVLGVVAATPSVCFYQIVVWIGIVWILVEVLHIRMGRCAVEVIIIFLDVFAVIPLAVGQAE